MKRYALIIHLFFWIALIFPTLSLGAQTPWQSHDQADVQVISGGYMDETTLQAAIIFKIDPGWKIYWKNPGDSGYPVQIKTNIGTPKIFWPIPTRTVDEFGTMTTETYTYSDYVVLPIRISGVSPTQGQNLIISLDYGICKTICIPVSAQFVLRIAPHHIDSSLTTLINQTIQSTPQPDGYQGITIDTVEWITLESDEPKLRVTASRDAGFISPDLFVDGDPNVAAYTPSVVLSDDARTVIFYVPVSVLTDHKELDNASIEIILTDEAGSVSKRYPFNDIQPFVAKVVEDFDVPESKYTLALILLFAFFGGLILNIMPCVLPVLSIKVFSVIHHEKSSYKEIAASFLITALGIIASFAFLALIMIALKTAGSEIGWGFHFQQPYFIASLIIILTFFAANMWGIFEVRLPTNWDLPSRFDYHAYVNYFLTGCFAALMATPCTAPFLGTAAGFALSQPPKIILGIFLVMGLGMAFPYILLAVFPSATKHFPKPGKWMIVVKRIMGHFIALTVLWLVWIILHQWGFVSAMLLLVLSILLVIALTSKNHRVILASFAVILALMIPKSLSKLPGEIKQIYVKQLWQPFNEDLIEEYVRRDRVVFVDITAAWCLTCKANKFVVLDSELIQKYLNAPNVVAMQADWTSHNPDITNYLKKYKRAGVPFNIVYGPGAPSGIVLSELLRKKHVVEAIKKAGQIKQKE